MYVSVTVQEYADLLRQTANVIDLCLQEDGSTVVPDGWDLQQQVSVLFADARESASEKIRWRPCENGHQLTAGNVYRLVPVGAAKPLQSAEETVAELGSTLGVLSQFASMSLEEPCESYHLKDKEVEIRRLPYGKWKKYVAFQDFDSSYALRVVPRQPQYVPFTYADREQLRGKWVVSKNGLVEICLSQFTDRFAGSIPWESLLETYVFLDTKQPVGKLAVE